ncbi:MAG: FimB/Mfa2 family fimbrial subunit [Mucilaginibacter sp.]
MKRSLLYSIVVVLFLFSCKKEHSKPKTNPDGKAYPINLNLSGFGETVTNAVNGTVRTNGLQTHSGTITDYLKILYYYVCDTNGKIVHFITQDSTSANFGQISDNLPSGTYTVIILAGQTGLSTHTIDIVGNEQLDDNYISYNGQWKDTFFNKFQLVVSGAPINQNITASRLVGQLEVNITDAIPATAEKMEITITPEDYDFKFGPALPSNPKPVVITTTIPAAAKGTTNYKVNNIVLNTTSSFTVKIVCYGPSLSTLGTALVTNVQCEKNRRTILSGKLFGSQNDFNVTLNTTWDPTVITIPFSNSYDQNR